jgi:hypothetical protein
METTSNQEKAPNGISSVATEEMTDLKSEATADVESISGVPSLCTSARSPRTFDKASINEATDDGTACPYLMIFRKECLRAWPAA